MAKTKTLATDEIGKLKRLREHLAEEIGEAYAALYASMEQIRRRHYYRLGELFIRLRMTFNKGHNGDREFAAFCRKKFPAIKQPAQSEYMTYRKKLGGKVSSSIAAAIHRAIPDHLPPLRRVTEPHVNDVNRPRDQYRRIVDDEVEEPTRFEVKHENETAMVRELAEKIISAGFRVLSVKMHPDKDGGSNLGMRRLNQAKKLLQDALIRAIARAI
jgi:hypothetical protein